MPFMPGLELSRYFYVEAMAPLLAKHYPRLAHSAARLDSGSEVLGFDTERSMDHWWGPRLQLFLRQGLWVPRPGGRSITCARSPLCGNSFAGSSVSTRFLYRPLTAGGWLALPEQHLRTIRSGGVWHDGTGELDRLRELLHWYPDQLWRYLLRAQWRRIGQEEAFPDRCAELGDALGSRVVAARLVREVMHLAFLLEREYMPYSKWLGTAFSRLNCAAELQPVLQEALAAASWAERERALSAASEGVAARFNALGLCERVPDGVSPFYRRPFQVIHGDRFAAALDATISDDEVRQLPPYFGNTTQWADSTDVLYPSHVARLASTARIGTSWIACSSSSAR